MSKTDDTISRQAAIDALRGYLVGKICPDDGTLTCRLIENEVINKLPTIHPKPSTNLAEVGMDCISRQAAIDVVSEWLWNVLHIKESDGQPSVFKRLRSLPSAQPKRGKWVLVCDNNGMHFVCDKCGAWRYYQEQNFCGECGADMRGEQDGNK